MVDAALGASEVWVEPGVAVAVTLLLKELATCSKRSFMTQTRSRSVHAKLSGQLQAAPSPSRQLPSPSVAESPLTQENGYSPQASPSSQFHVSIPNLHTACMLLPALVGSGTFATVSVDVVVVAAAVVVDDPSAFS